MASFKVYLLSATQNENIEKVVSFIGADSSGKFGILAHHIRLISCLTYGLATLRYETNEIEYLAIPSGLLYFINNELYIITRHYVRSKNYQDIVNALDQRLHDEEKKLHHIKESIHQLDKQMVKNLLELKSSIMDL